MKRGILATIDELHALAPRIRTRPFDSLYDRLDKRCSLVLETTPITEAMWRQTWQQGQWGSAVKAVQIAQGRILDLLIAHHIDHNTAYRDRAIEELRDLVRWSTWVDPCHSPLPADLCTAEACVAVAVALDWLWEDLPPADRDQAVAALRTKGVAAYLEGVRRQAWWYNCYHNWNAVLNSGCGLAALALSDECKESKRAYGLAKAGLKHFFDALGREGGWDEGLGYWGYAMRYLLLFGEACSRLADDQSVFHARGMNATGLFPVYFTPNGHAASFGDHPAVPLLGALYLLARRYERPEIQWWLDTYAFHKDTSATDWSRAGLAMVFRPSGAPAKRAPKLEPLKVFREIGWAALADAWPKPTMYVAVKTGDLAASHSQRDMNSLQLQVDGEMVLTDVGSGQYSREYFSPRRGEFYEVQARAHNTIVVAEEDHRIDAHGDIVAGGKGKCHRWVSCDAGDAAGENVRFLRHVVLVLDRTGKAGRMLVVLDELLNGTPERVDLYWHTAGEVAAEAGSMAGVIAADGVSLQYALASTVKASAVTETHKLHSGGSDRVIHLTAGVMGEALFAGVFSRDALPGGAKIVQEEEGRATVVAGGVEVQFKPAKGRLQLGKVRWT